MEIKEVKVDTSASNPQDYFGIGRNTSYIDRWDLFRHHALLPFMHRVSATTDYCIPEHKPFMHSHACLTSGEGLIFAELTDNVSQEFLDYCRSNGIPAESAKASDERSTAAFLRFLLCRELNAWFQRDFLPQLQQAEGDNYLRIFAETWQSHANVCRFLDRFEAKGMEQSGPSSTSHECLMFHLLKVFRKSIYVPQEERLMDVLLQHIARDRNGEPVNTVVFKQCISCIEHMGIVGASEDSLLGLDTIVEGSDMKSDRWKLLPQLLRYRNTETYRIDFQERFLETTRIYLKSKASTASSHDEISLYLAECNNIISTELERCKKLLLHDQTSTPLEALLNDELLRERLDFILKSRTGVAYLLEQDRFEDLRIMYRMLKRIDACDDMVKTLRQHIEACGRTITDQRVAYLQGADARETKAGASKANDASRRNRRSSDRDDPRNDRTDFIKGLCELYAKYERVVRDELGHDEAFTGALSLAFRNISADQPAHRAEIQSAADDRDDAISTNEVMLAGYADTVLKSSAGSEDIRERLRLALKLFDAMINKDVFISFHEKFMKDRLLGATSQLSEEREFVNRLKLTQGANQTSKLENMLHNIDHRDTNMERAWETKWNGPDSEHMKSSWDGDRRFEVQLLNMASWPPFPQLMNLRIPAPANPAAAAYEHFYKQWPGNANKLLLWAHTVGQMELAYTPIAGRTTYKMVMTPLQGFLCLAFESRDDAKNIQELHDLCNMEPDNRTSNQDFLKAHLASLTFCRIPILRMEDPALPGQRVRARAFRAQYTFRPNVKYKNRNRRVTVDKPKLRSRREAMAKVMQERRYTVGAAIVRVMKASRGAMTGKDLNSAVMSQLAQWSPTRRDIKQALDYVIEKNYVRRDENDSRLFHYVPEVTN